MNYSWAFDYSLFIVLLHLRQNGYTPLHLAAAQGHKEVIKALLEFEAQVDDQDQVGDYDYDSTAAAVDDDDDDGDIGDCENLIDV